MTKFVTTIVESPTEPKFNAFIDGVMNQLAQVPLQLQAGTPALVLRATTMPDLRTKLQEAEKVFSSAVPNPTAADEHLIQIVGHGTPGILSVGYSFRQSRQAEGKWFILDSNPYNYGVLKVPLSHRTRLSLVGCSVGESPTVNVPAVANGATLIFDLEQMWQRPVSASTGIVKPHEFDATSGVFGGAQAGLAVTDDDFVAEALVKPRPSVTSILSTPSMAEAPHGGDDYLLTAEESAELAKYYSRELKDPDTELSALPEITFATWGEDGPSRASVILNGQVLRYFVGSSIRDFVHVVPPGGHDPEIPITGMLERRMRVP